MRSGLSGCPLLGQAPFLLRFKGIVVRGEEAIAACVAAPCRKGFSNWGELESELG